ncbi:MAG: hypothetical protein E7514_06835 [Ruminococcaceae bacterium]|nr:hypothetical protein [Oscillospiraceae bacterium]
MTTIIYVIIKYITVAGTFSKAFFEHLTCRVYRILIEDGRYLVPTEMCGHIEHEFIRKKGVIFGLCFFPFLYSLIIGLIFTGIGSMNLFYLGEFYFGDSNVPNFLNFAYLWLGISFLTNLFPQIEDALTLKELIYNKETNFLTKVLASPIFAILYCGAYLERYGITFITSIVFAFLMPKFFAAVLPSML